MGKGEGIVLQEKWNGSGPSRKSKRRRKKIGMMLREADVKEQIEEQHERTDNSRYNQRYQKLYTITKPMYLTAQYEGRNKKLQNSDAER